MRIAIEKSVSLLSYYAFIHTNNKKNFEFAPFVQSGYYYLPFARFFPAPLLFLIICKEIDTNARGHREQKGKEHT